MKIELSIEELNIILDGIEDTRDVLRNKNLSQRKGYNTILNNLEKKINQSLGEEK